MTAVGDIRERLGTVGVETIFGVLLAAGVVVLVLDLLRRLATGSLAAASLRQYLWWGVSDGLIFGLAAIGLSMTYSILRFANFSHGDLLTTGAFSGWTAAYVVGGFAVAEATFSNTILLRAGGGVAPGTMNMHVLAQPAAIFVGAIVAALVTIAVALFFDRVVYRRMRDAGGIPILIASVGVAFVLRYTLGFVYTPSSHRVVASAPTTTVNVGVWESTYSLHRLTMVGSAIVLMVGVHLLLQYTKLGTSMRAMADNKDLALITGIPTERVVTWTWVVGAGLAGIGGYLIVLDRSGFTINLGWFLLLVIFASVILGGIGSIYGAILGALIIGVTMNLSLIWIPHDLNRVAAFALMILILIYRPDGLLGGVRTA